MSERIGKPRIITSAADLNSDERAVVYDWGPPLERFIGIGTTDGGILSVTLNTDQLDEETMFYLQEIGKAIDKGKFVGYLLDTKQLRLRWKEMERIASDAAQGFEQKFGYSFTTTTEKEVHLGHIFYGQHWAPFPNNLYTPRWQSSI